MQFAKQLEKLQGLFKEKAFFDLVKIMLGVVLSIIVLIIFLKDPLQKFELITFDYRMKNLPARPTHPDIVLVEMAEDSINAIGRWPWPREWHATLITALSQYKAKAIMFDVLFSEPGPNLGDISLEGAIEKAGSVYLPFAFEFKTKGQKEIVRNIIFPLDRFSRYAKGQGHISISPDIDGTIRRSPLIIDYKGGRYPQFAFQVACDYLGVKKEDLISTIPVDSENRMIIKWAGRWKETFKHYSYIDIIASYQNLLTGKKPRINLEYFEGKICLVGLTATGLHDVRPSSIEPAYPALGVNANIINNILNKDFVRQAPRFLDGIIILILGFLVSLAVSKLHLLRGVLVAILILVGYLFISITLFKFFGLWINIVYPVFLIAANYSIITLFSQISMVIERSRLFRLATRDGITGLYVLRHFNLLLEAEMGISDKHRYRRKLSIIMGDIDFFKKINDTYGHQGGNIILKGIADIIRANCRELDVPCRYGGEEFIMMLPGTMLEEARIVAERIKKGVEEHRYLYNNEILRVTISFGVTSLKDEKTRDEFIKKADDALYEAKRTGRNRVCVAKD